MANALVPLSEWYVCTLHADVSVVEAMVDKVLAANPKQLADYKGGKTKLAGFFTGQVG